DSKWSRANASTVVGASSAARSRFWQSAISALPECRLILIEPSVQSRKGNGWRSGGAGNRAARPPCCWRPGVPSSAAGAVGIGDAALSHLELSALIVELVDLHALDQNRELAVAELLDSRARQCFVDALPVDEGLSHFRHPTRF